jgi:hypothetical protein
LKEDECGRKVLKEWNLAFQDGIFCFGGENEG